MQVGMKMLHLLAVVLTSMEVSIYILVYIYLFLRKEKVLPASNLSSSLSMSVHSSQEQKKAGLCNAFATHASCVRKVAIIQIARHKNGSTHAHVSANFKFRFSTNRMEN